MENLPERGGWENLGTWLDLTPPTPTFHVSYGSAGEGGPVMADAGEHLCVREEEMRR